MKRVIASSIFCIILTQTSTTSAMRTKPIKRNPPYTFPTLVKSEPRKEEFLWSFDTRAQGQYQNAYPKHDEATNGVCMLLAEYYEIKNT